MNSQINHNTFIVFRSTEYAFCFLLIVMTSALVGSNHSVSTQASSHSSSCEPSKMWHTGSWVSVCMSFTTLLYHRQFSFETTCTTPLLSSAQPPLWAQTRCCLEGKAARQSSRKHYSTCVASAPDLRTLFSKLMIQSGASKVVVGEGLPACLQLLLLCLASAAWGMKGYMAVPANVVFFPIYPVLKPSISQHTLRWLSLLIHKSPGTHFTTNSMHYYAHFRPSAFSIY